MIRFQWIQWAVSRLSSSGAERSVHAHIISRDVLLMRNINMKSLGLDVFLFLPMCSSSYLFTKQRAPSIDYILSFGGNDIMHCGLCIRIQPCRRWCFMAPATNGPSHACWLGSDADRNGSGLRPWKQDYNLLNGIAELPGRPSRLSTGEGLITFLILIYRSSFAYQYNALAGKSKVFSRTCRYSQVDMQGIRRQIQSSEQLPGSFRRSP